METRILEKPVSIENEVELRGLCNMLRLAEGFTLGFARVNHPSLQERLVAEVRHRLPDRTIQEVILDPRAGGGIVSQLEDAIGTIKPDAIFVTGLEAMLDLRVSQSREMSLLNLNRDYCGNRFPCPIVFWGPEYAIREVRRQAPDFWSWRSGTYYFTGDSDDARSTLEGAVGSEDWSADLRERLGRQEILQHLLAELDESGEPNPRVLARVLLLLGRAEEFEGENRQAEQYYLKALSMYRVVGDRLRDARCVRSLGDVALRQGRYEDAKQLLEESLPIHRQLGDRRGEANCLLLLGRLGRATHNLEVVRSAYLEAESIYAAIGIAEDAEIARKELATYKES